MLKEGITPAALGAAGDLVLTDQHVVAVTALETEKRPAAGFGLQATGCRLESVARSLKPE